MSGIMAFINMTHGELYLLGGGELVVQRAGGLR